ncbi:hypothetical protein AncyloWKF20_08915 [Ancylobacter sp. WKF20]|uniref:hypothetical protein n=1 Tax=Ancylobacter sp. WKF20 TaxID=3039801 RepID=UPI0024344F1C|nr:hypothetical protein [Ancylobacter sp. WKF20]WGD31923.1 hypothetical protein AncyloWKF20_08915 [Ancylobacter sp. WKF20]
MTTLFDKAIAAARALPDQMQDDIARALIALAEEQGACVPLNHTERAAIEQSRATAARGDFASDDEVRAAWATHGL